MVSRPTLIVRCQPEDETAMEVTAHPPSYAEVEKMKSSTLRMHAMATSGLVYGTAFHLLIICVRISPTLISSVSLTFVLINPRPLMKLRLRAPSIENGIKTELMASTRAPIDIHSCPLTQRCPKQDTVTPTQPTHRQYSLLYRPNKNSPIQDYSFIITKLL